MSDYDARLAELGITLPDPEAAVALYSPTVLEKGFLFVAGQIGFRDGDIVTGRASDNDEVEEGRAAAELAAKMVVSQIRNALGGSLNRVRRVVRVGVFINATNNFQNHATIADGASGLFISIFGDAGRHARTSIGSNALPVGALVEVEAIVSVDD